jgi:hypothetical protein
MDYKPNKNKKGIKSLRDLDNDELWSVIEEILSQDNDDVLDECWLKEL